MPSSTQNRVPTRCQSSQGEGLGLVELADQIVRESAAPVLHEMLSRTGAAEALNLPGAGRPASAAEIFDSFASSTRSKLRDQLEQHFEIVALPRAPLERELREADIVLRRGEAQMGHIALVASPELKDRETLLSAGLKPESSAAGNFVLVVEGGARPHTRADGFARRVTESSGAVPRDTMVLRLRTSDSEAVWEGLAESANSLLRDIVILRLATPPTVVTTPQSTIVNVTGVEKPGDSAAEDDVSCDHIDASHISWPGASTQHLDFMRRVYLSQVLASCRVRQFVADVPDSELGAVESGERARQAAADQCRALLAAARSAILSDPQAPNLTVGVVSGYRSASQQFNNWNRNFPRYYQEAQSDLQGAPVGEFGNAAVSLLAHYIAGRLAAPGFSLHNDGRAIDFLTVQAGRSMGADTHEANRRNWRTSWFLRWLMANANGYGFYQNTSIDEPWHWEFRKTSAQSGQSKLESGTEQEGFVCEGELANDAWTGSAEQLAFREQVLNAHMARSEKRSGPPKRDLNADELSPVRGTSVKMRTDAAESASKLLEVANADLGTAADADASKTIQQ
jgi:hypothetical protein